MLYVFLSHDVDWRRQGPSKEHILARKDRFEQTVLENLDSKNPYYNIPEIMAIEEKFGVKSTFFFRTIYENGNLQDYEDDIKSLVDEKWEVGLHSDPSSVASLNKLRQEKNNLESITNTPIRGNRVHYLQYDDKLPSLLEQLEFQYDSSIRHTKDKMDKAEMGFSKLGRIVEFPVTLMDAYLFTHMKLKESQIIPTFEKTINVAKTLESEIKIMTILWHDNVLKMVGGRMYQKIIEYLSTMHDVQICRGIDLVNIIKKKN